MFVGGVIEIRIARSIGDDGALPDGPDDVHVGCAGFDYHAGCATLGSDGCPKRSRRHVAARGLPSR